MLRLRCLKISLGIHTENFTKFIDTKKIYLNRFRVLSFPISTANKSNIKFQTLYSIMQKERALTYVLGARRALPVILHIKEGNLFAAIGDIGKTLHFHSLTSCKTYLNSIGAALSIKTITISKYINTKKTFHNFVANFDYLPNSQILDEQALLIDEYKSKDDANKKTFNDELNLNKQKKPILVKLFSSLVPVFDATKSISEQKFPSITDTIKKF